MTLRFTPEQYEAYERRRVTQIGRVTQAQKTEMAATWNGNSNVEVVTLDAVGTSSCKASVDVTRSPAPAKLVQVPTPESAVLKAVLVALRIHPMVAWAERMNVMSQTLQYKGVDRYVKAGFKGLSDIIGMLRDGRFLAVEVKRPGGQPTQAQIEFLGLVDRSGGVAFIARSVDDVIRALAAPKEAA